VTFRDQDDSIQCTIVSLGGGKREAFNRT